MRGNTSREIRAKKVVGRNTSPKIKSQSDYEINIFLLAKESLLLFLMNMEKATILRLKLDQDSTDFTLL